MYCNLYVHKGCQFKFPDGRGPMSDLKRHSAKKYCLFKFNSEHSKMQFLQQIGTNGKIQLVRKAMKNLAILSGVRLGLN